MAIGDVGGDCGDMIITCQTLEAGKVDIKKGDAVCLVGSYRVTDDVVSGAPIFGQALADCSENDTTIPVKVRGICKFAFDGQYCAPSVNHGVVMTQTPPGYVRGPDGSTQEGNGSGPVLNVSVDGDKGTVDVLL